MSITAVVTIVTAATLSGVASGAVAAEGSGW